MLDIEGILKFINPLISFIFVCSLVYEFLWLYKNKKKNGSESAKAASWTELEVLLVKLTLSTCLSFILRMINPNYIPLMIACNFISEIPILVLVVLICTGWPLVKNQLLLQRKGNMLLLVSIFLMELCLVPYLNMIVFPHNLDNPNRYFESLNIFKFLLLFQTFKSATIYLKEQGIATSSQASINVYTTQLFRTMFFYYPFYLVCRAILTYFFFYSRVSIYLNELLSWVFFSVIACKFVPELVLEGVVDDESFLTLLKRHPLLFKSSTTN